MRSLRRLNHTTAAAYLALFSALGGTSYAAFVLPDNSVGSRHIRQGAVGTGHLQGNAVTSVKVRDGSLLARDFATGQIPAGPQGAKGDKGDLGPQGPPGPTGPAGSDGGFVGMSAGGDLAGTYPNPQVASGAIGSPELAVGAVGTTRLADDAVTSAKILDGEIASADIADGGIGTMDIADGAVNSTKIADGSVDTIDINASAITTGLILDGTVGSVDLADGDVQTVDLADGAVTSIKIGAGEVHTTNIFDGAVTSAKIADGTIVLADIDQSVWTTAHGSGLEAAKPAANAANAGHFWFSTDLDGGTLWRSNGVSWVEVSKRTMPTSNIQDGSITLPKLAIDSVDGSKVVDNSLTSADIQNGTIQSVDIMNGTILGIDIADMTIQGIDIDNGTVTEANLAPGVFQPIGSVTVYAGVTAPPGWMFADGSTPPISRATYAALFATIGTTYGAGDGVTTFGLPTIAGPGAGLKYIIRVS